MLITANNKKAISLVDNFNRVYPNHLNGVLVKDIDFSNVESWYKNYIINMLAPVLEIDFASFNITLTTLLQSLLDINLYILLNVEDEQFRVKLMNNLIINNNQLELIERKFDSLTLTEEQSTFVNFVSNYIVSSNPFFTESIIDILGDKIALIKYEPSNE